MGYYIRELRDKKKFPRWKVQFVSYKKEDREGTKVRWPKKEWDVPHDRWRALGFIARMSAVEARARARQLNALAIVKKQELQLRKLRLEELDLQKRNQAFLPEEFTAEFELKYLRSRDSQSKRRRNKMTRAHILWRAVQKLIVHIKVEPTEWNLNQDQIYDYFFERSYSLSYLNKMLNVLNPWGFFICKKIDAPYLSVQRPRGYERQRLVDRYYENIGKRKRASRPLSPILLNSAKEKMRPKQFNWLFVSVWLGLRPREIDNLGDKNLWKVEELATGTKVLWVYQTKLIALPPIDRWKPVPLIYDEQKFAAKIIEDGLFERPLNKTVRRYFGEGVTLYGGRKGFTDLMLGKGHTLEAISQWMGHSTIGRTWRTYKDRLGVEFSMPNKVG